ncbi:MAG: hypothetical protein COA58_15930 [Bacteroidetes bacterium]|nr:MAG: hypothetical protein COA58_15930 [Bacteroidota bacterium]
MISCNYQIDNSKVEGKWKVDSAVRLADGLAAPNTGLFLIFKHDSTLVSESEYRGVDKATWTLSENNLLIIEHGDTTIWEIEELTNSKMILVSDLGGGKLRLKLLKECESTEREKR